MDVVVAVVAVIAIVAIATWLLLDTSMAEPAGTAEELEAEDWSEYGDAPP